MGVMGVMARWEMRDRLEATRFGAPDRNAVRCVIRGFGAVCYRSKRQSRSARQEIFPDGGQQPAVVMTAMRRP